MDWGYGPSGDTGELEGHATREFGVWVEDVGGRCRGDQGPLFDDLSLNSTGEV